MSFTHTIFNGIPQPSRLSVNRNGTRFITEASKRKENGGPTSRNQQLPKFQLKVSNTVIARSVVVVFGLGFIDAGYSGDWSRIGVISKDVEDLLKIAAFLVVPFCIFLVSSFSKQTPDT
ncbi:DNA-directed RNA polymerase subunit beta' [Gossypium australe]|uniref:DNA-directed RNA polymerase subunit beta n=1 Tax=Gossypium australe TaxID=47621 RepID=A0A5B6U4M8_9ROSI|nr:DNA-directed RNA polymerase subunit beta' [Gossypium australe]